MSATLLASLFTVVVAGPASAAVSLTNAGSFAQGGTSASEVTVSFTERTVNSVTATGTMTVNLYDSASAATISWVGTPVVSAPGSLGASASVAGGVLTVKITGQDPLNKEPITITGLKLKASATAASGAIIALLNNGVTPLTQPAAGYVATTTTATGKLAQAYGLGTISIIVAVDASSPCDFVGATAATVGGEDVTVSAVAANAPVAGQDTLTISATTTNHLANEVVTATVANCNVTALASPGTVKLAADFESTGNPIVYPGENNAHAANVTLAEPKVGFLADGTTITLAITTPGVTFSTRPIVSSVSALSGVQTLTVAALGFAHAVGTAVTQTHLLCTSSGTLSAAAAAAAVSLSVMTTTPACPFTTTVALVDGPISIAAPNAESVAASVATAFLGASPTLLVSNISTLSADRRSATWTVDTASAALTMSMLTFSNIYYDVALTVPGGTYIELQLSLSGGLFVLPSTAQNAIVNRGITATASPATVYIGENAQKSGLTTLTELQAGFFSGGLGTNNTFGVCLTGPEFFTSPGPWAKVASGDLRLRDGATASATNIVQGTAIFNTTYGDFCYTWTIWSASTAVSSIVIGNSDFTSGPLIDVPANTVPGTVPMSIFIGNDVFSLFNNPAAIVQIATRMFRNQVVVTALSQPMIAAGSTDALAGNIQVAETAPGQLKAGEDICFDVRPRVSNETFQDTYLKALNTSDIPMATATGGLVISPVTMSTSFCNLQESLVNPTLHTVSFKFTVLQQSVSGTGNIVVSNIHYITTADAPAGNVLVNAYGFGGSPTVVVFQSTISNAKIGSGIGGTAGTAKGVTHVGPFSTSTKVQLHGKYVTYRFDFGFAAAGKAVKIWGSTKTGGDWAPWAVVTTRVANASGVVYYYIRQSSATWRSYRAQFVDGGLMTPARQARWI